MSFAADVQVFIEKAEQRQQGVFRGFAEAAKESIVEGSPVTGAPGQPVAEGQPDPVGKLKGSWELEYPTPTTAEIATDVDYAPKIEDGIGEHGPLRLRSKVGGFHSVALTVAGAERLLEQVVREVIQETGG